MSPRTRLALLVSPHSFEGFYEDHLGLDRQQYVTSYRNDFVAAYSAGLREHGVDVVTYMPSLRQTRRDTAEDGTSVRFVPVPSVWRLMQPVLAHAVTPLERYAMEAGQALLMLPGLRSALREDRIDVLYVQEYWTGRFDVLVRLAGLPVVAGEHGGSEGMHVHVGKGEALRRAAAITVQSRAEGARLQRRYGTQTQYVPNGIDTGFFTPADAERDQSLLVVARLVDAQKRVSDLIRAVKLLPEPWVLDVVGKGPDENMLRELAVGEGVGDRVRFHGWEADRAQLRERYRRCGAFVLPSVWEAVTLAVLEAMACGAVPVVTPLRPFVDVIRTGENGLIVEPARPDLLAAAAQQAYAERSRLGRAARETVVDRFDVHRTTGDLAQLVHSIASRR